MQIEVDERNWRRVKSYGSVIEDSILESLRRARQLLIGLPERNVPRSTLPDKLLGTAQAFNGNLQV
jgi:hypothetical protein